MSQAGELNVVQNHPDIPTSFSTNSGNAVPIANELEILGVGAISTSGATNVITIHATGIAETLTGNSGGAVSPDGANNINVVGDGVTITVAGNPGTHTLTISEVGGAYISLSPYIVGSDVHSGYATIAAGYAAAVAAGAPQNVIVKPGTYTENITLTAGINLIALNANATTPSVIINGKLSASFAGTVSLSGLCLQTNGDNAIAVTGASATNIFVKDCYFSLVANTAINMTSSGGPLITVINCQNKDAGNNAFFTLTNNGNIRIVNSFLLGGTTACTASGTASIDIKNSVFNYPISTSGSATVGLVNSEMFMSGASTALTVGGTVGGNVAYLTRFDSNTASAISISAGAALSVSHCPMNSSNTHVLTGAGTLNYAFISFTGSSSGHNVTTETPFATLI